MGQSVVYSGMFGAVLASIPALRTHVVAFDTSVADLTSQMSDPVDVLMGIQLGGGTDINRALAYCQTLITRPTDTILVLITDLFEGGDRDEMLKRAAAIAGSGVRVVTLLALADSAARRHSTNETPRRSRAWAFPASPVLRIVPGFDGCRRFRGAIWASGRENKA